MARGRKHWDPRRSGVLHKIGWEPSAWRDPDLVGGDTLFTWWGPDGIAGDYLTMVESISSSIAEDELEYNVTEYVPVEGQIENPPGPILKTSVLVDKELLDAAAQIMPELRRLLKNSDFKSKVHAARIVAGIGVAKLAYFGGEEEFVDEAGG